MALLEDYIQDVTPGLVIVPDALEASMKEMIDREVAKYPEAERERDIIRSQLIAFFSRYGYLPEFTLEPRDQPVV